MLGNAGVPTDYLGWDNTNPFPLPIRHDGNQPINWFTDAIERLSLLPNATYTIGSFPAQVRDGSLLLSPDVGQFYFNGAPGPFSLLHLASADDNAQVTSFRDWMNTGVTFTGNADQNYVGQKATGFDTTDMVIHWSDNPGKALKDRMRFLFTSGYSSSATTGATSKEGLEGMRLFPVDYDKMNVGIGDFYAGHINFPSTVNEPSERLDVLDGRVRIRQLPDDSPADSQYVVMVVDTTPSPSGERGVVKWVPASAIADDGCEWGVTSGTGAGANPVWTAVGGLVDHCPDKTDAVGIGTKTPDAKLHVLDSLYADGLHVKNVAPLGNTRGAYVQASGGSTNTVGVASEATSTGSSNSAFVGLASGGTNQNIGVFTLSTGGGTNNTGALALCNSASNTNTAFSGVVSGTAVRNIGSRLTVTGGTTSNIGDTISVTGSAATHRGAVMSVANGTGTNQGLRLNANSTSASVTNEGVRMICETPNGSVANRGLMVSLRGNTTRSRGIEVEDSSNATFTGYGGFFKLHSSSPPYSYGIHADNESSNTSGSGGFAFGVWGRCAGTPTYSVGVCGTAGLDDHLNERGYYGVFGQSSRDEQTRNIGTAGYVGSHGVRFPAYNARTGVAGVTRPADSQMNVGTLGYVGNGAPPSLITTIGVYGEARDWAGWFQGDTWTQGIGFFTAGAFTISDQSLKENVAEVPEEETSAVVSQLHPVSYTFTPEAVEDLNVPEGEQVGLLAQELEQVLPGLVKEVVHPAVMDTLGNVIQAEQTLKTVNYTGLIPYLIADNQRLQARLDDMQEMIAACCAAGADQRAAQPASAALLETDLRIIPNPVADRTELRYTVGSEGRVRLEITDASSRIIQVQDEGTRTTGTFSYGWDTTSLAAGTYFCTLCVNDEPLVKKAVKLNVR